MTRGSYFDRGDEYALPVFMSFELTGIFPIPL